MRIDRRLVRGVLCLSLPTLAVIALAVRFALVDVPRLVEDERERVLAACETVSRELLEDPSSADFVWRRGRGVEKGAEVYAALFPADLGWKDWVSAGRAKTKEKWGFLERPEGRLVWVRDTQAGGDPNVVYGRRTDLAERNWTALMAVFGGFSLAVLVGVTCFGIRFFITDIKTRDDFMAATAHDLTTPLVGLRLTIGRDEAEARVLVERLLRLVKNVTDFLRLGGRRRAPELAPVDLARAFDEAYALFREDYRDQFDGADVAVGRIGLPEEGAVGVLADETMLVQILWNLLGNDLKYAAPYGAVRVVFRAAGDRLLVEFIDEGQGMTPAEMAHAFDRYYRAKTVLASGKGGFGIGLCTAREFAEAMGGALTVRANAPRGCIFTLALRRPGVVQS